MSSKNSLGILIPFYGSKAIDMNAETFVDLFKRATLYESIAKSFLCGSTYTIVDESAITEKDKSFLMSHECTLELIDQSNLLTTKRFYKITFP